MRIAYLLQRWHPDAPAPRINPVTREIVARLRARGARVALVVPENRAWDLGALRPAHDLYVLKSKTPLALSLGGALAAAGARFVNTVRASSLARDKVAATVLLAAAGVPVPPSWATGSAPALAPLLAGGGLWVKPPRGSKGRGVHRVETAGALAAAQPPPDVGGVPRPLFAQREVPSGGRDLKVYVVGECVWAVAKPWPARTARDKRGRPVPVPAAIRDAALACGRALGLEIYGADFLVAGDRFFCVDVNALPGFRGPAEAPAAIADYLYERARA